VHVHPVHLPGHAYWPTSKDNKASYLPVKMEATMTALQTVTATDLFLTTTPVSKPTPCNTVSHRVTTIR